MYLLNNRNLELRLIFKVVISINNNKHNYVIDTILFSTFNNINIIVLSVNSKNIVQVPFLNK
jgi:hypothetical protein